MWLLVGLGNPGKKYQGNRHNAGFMVADELARRFANEAFRDKFGGQVAGGMMQHEKVLLLKPMEFMNLSGFAVQRAATFHDVPPERIVVIHDEKDIDLGRIKVKAGGGHGGHNGLRSIIQQLGGNEFLRVRVGVGAPPLPPGIDAETRDNRVAGYLLSDFPAAERKEIEWAIPVAASAVEAVVHKGITAAMNEFNS
ncbi:MAG TPA: aminoacyl-tRNA hydrolase [Kofleriaceae bacterium]|jgi:PTH1 family peptidyl-tRNA hydrolase|nr:aminoacyl-tRNA hydrolase [Kofleriaceae bacterium]